MRWLDHFGESLTRKVAHASSRRSVLCSIGKVFVGTAFVMPVLPVARIARAAEAAPKTDLETATEEELASCDYWRYCAVDGFLCTCCGGSATTCPPGSEPSPISWVGTCHNPKDGKDYLVSYHDCCGKTACGRCYCGGQVRERPGYEFFLHNDVNWCMANSNTTYHCTVSTIVGLGKN
ncbi:methylamine dehydrogenase light chain [Castellaniella sp. WN]|jgi:aralkylamine dehydrogenase light chain/methylamine dehydrogenase light chain